MHHRRPLSQIAGSLMVLVAMTGCASVRIDAGPGQVKTERHWGVLGIHVDSPDRSYTAEMQSFGLAASPFGWSAGYARHSWASLGPDCRLVIWVSQAEHLEAARRLAASQAGICVASPAPDNPQEESHHESRPPSPAAGPGDRP